METVQFNQLMLCKEKIAACSKNHAKHLNAICGKDAEILNIDLSGEKSDRWPLRDEDLQLPYGKVRGGSRFCGA